ncbi:MAG: hypothetical protein Q9225_001566 [Loekoesia sp. 1 TL-2023]
MTSPGQSYTPVSGEDRGSNEPSAESSANPSRESSRPPKPKNKVRFTPGGESLDNNNQRAAFDLRDESSLPTRASIKPRPFPRQKSLAQRSHSTGSAPHPLDAGPSKDATKPSLSENTRPGLPRNPSSSDSESTEEGNGDGIYLSSEAAGRRAYSQQSAHDRAERLSRTMGSHSAPGSRTASPLRPSNLRSPPPSPPHENQAPPLDFENIPLSKLQSRRTYGIEDETDEDEEKKQKPIAPKKHNSIREAAARLVRYHTTKRSGKDGYQRHDHPHRISAPPTPLRSGQATPVHEQTYQDYVPRPTEYREGFLSSILKLYNEQGLGAALTQKPVGNVGMTYKERRQSNRDSLLNREIPESSSASSGTTTPKAARQKWYKNQQASSTGSLSNLIHSATALAHPGGSPVTAPPDGNGHIPRPNSALKSRSVSALDTMLGRNKSPKPDDSIHIQVHIAETMTRQAYLMKMCKALMNYGAPTHRLEGCMIISFDDSRTHTTEVKIVRTNQAIDLGKLREVHEIYKETLHDLIGVEEAMERLDRVLQRKQQYNRWLLIPVYGLASASVGPFAFGARPIDLPIAFLLGCCLGIMQLILAPKSELYSNIFEVTAAVLTSFLARAFGSIRNGEIFCFSALAQSSIALILPGYTVLCGALELQSRNILAGSVRMVYAIIYSLFLGYGITIGTSFYGGIDSHATSKVSCNTQTPTWFSFVFVPPFTLCLIIINQGKWKQTPAMLVIAFTGYVVNHFSAQRFASNAQIANTLGALAVGVMGNLYSRLRHGVAAAALLPAIFVQVPSGLAASGSLVSGVTSADQITNRTDVNGVTTVSNGTQGAEATVNSMVFNVGYTEDLIEHLGRRSNGQTQRKLRTRFANGVSSQQLLSIWRRAKGKERDVLLWGDEVEYLVVAFDEQQQKVKLSLRQADILDALSKDEALQKQGGCVPDLQKVAREGDSLPTFHPEFGRFMLEATPGKPWGIGIKDLLDVEPNMKWRRSIAKEHMEPNEYPITLTTFPRLGTRDEFITPYIPPSGERLRSQFLPDQIANPHIRFPTLAANIRARRGRKVEINVPIYRDENTPMPFKDPTVDYDLHKWPEDDDVRNGATKDNHIYMDAMAFGMGSCCLQITFQAKNIVEGRKLYDQLSPLGPILLALTAATPIYKGFLADTDVRWNQISRAVDDRTPEELGEKPLQHNRWRLPKSRYASNSTYIAQDSRLRKEYMDPDLVVDEDIKQRLMDEGMDDLLATHFAHLFIRDPIVIFGEDLKKLDLDKTDHFENLQSTNWQHMRFKPPPSDNLIGWRVEFRPMEIQMTDFENAAFSIFIVLVTRAILSFDLNFYIPIPRTTENMETAHARDAVSSKKFYFRKDPFPPRPTKPMSNGHTSGNVTPASFPSRPPTPTGPVEDEYSLMTIDEIINGQSSTTPSSTPAFPGLIPLVESYLNSMNIDVQTRWELGRYLELIRKRANGKLWTAAKWIRYFVRGHGEYKGDSVVSEKMTYDLVKAAEEITRCEGKGNEEKGGIGWQMFTENPSMTRKRKGKSACGTFQPPLKSTRLPSTSSAHPSTHTSAPSALKHESDGDGTASKKRRISTATSSRGVANLTPEQLEKKRANDREAQRAIRERNKIHIETLEKKIRELSNQQPQQELQTVRRQKQLVESENVNIKKKLSAALSLLQPLLGSQGGEASDSAPIQNSASASPTFPPPSPIQPNHAAISQMPTYTSQGPVYPQASAPLDQQRNNLAQGLHIKTSGERLNLGFLLDGRDTSQNGGSPHAGQRIPAYPRVNTNIHTGPAAVQTPKSHEGFEPPLVAHNVPIKNIPPTCPLDTILLDFLAERRARAAEGASPTNLVGPPYPSVSSLLNPERSIYAHPLSKVFTDILSKFPDLSALPEQVAVLYVMFLIMRWQISPTQENYERLPEWVTPRASQLFTPHPAWVDHIPWPRMRDRMVHLYPDIPLDNFFIPYTTTLSLNWNYEDSDTLLSMPGSDEFSINPVFERHLRDLGNWTLGSAFEKAFPKLADTCKIKREERGKGR